jgi:hypothetical protein
MYLYIFIIIDELMYSLNVYTDYKINNRDEEFFAISLSDAATQTLGHDMSVIVKGGFINNVCHMFCLVPIENSL